ncbi:P-loop containing nucleoside triphosphate hydrolases superfamily protein [Perilla frutescens var. hirtella]|nr:P-loop containing nucleoside triphosphate hydrolases superfamily protein [Perilla frutescens var. frutescens]KAH6783769.1 P-loop containing nucleoside triphosphate hydrolases superfamily protein [Perilla frutescens var. hirtella]
MFLTHRFPRIHSHLFTSPKPHKLFLITSTLLSKSKTPIPPPLPLPLSHFSTLTPTPTTTTPPQQQESLQLSLETLFIPPETDVSSLKDAPLTARILKGSNIVLSKFAGDGVDVVNAEFVKSSVKTEDCPSDRLPEFALVGRSNVGKSSLLNSLVRRKRLALTSKKPGKTQCINHFRINDSWYLVDLPGYGYAAAPHEVRTDWAKFTKDYFLNRPTLVSVFLLIDASIPAKPIDLEYASWLGQNEIPMTLVFTKCDKRKKKKNGGKRPEENVRDFQELIRDFFQTAPPWIMTSSVTNQGRDEILLHMSQLRNYWLKH